MTKAYHCINVIVKILSKKAAEFMSVGPYVVHNVLAHFSMVLLGQFAGWDTGYISCQW